MDMWKKSGHFENYRENMYFTKVDEVEYGIKPMNCLSHLMVYKSQVQKLPRAAAEILLSSGPSVATKSPASSTVS